MGRGLRVEEKERQTGSHRTRLWQRGLHQVISHVMSVFAIKLKFVKAEIAFEN